MCLSEFDCILMDLHMPVRELISFIEFFFRSGGTLNKPLVDGEGAARYIKSTNSKNTSTPIIAVSAYSGVDQNDASNVFAASLSKPVQKADLLAIMRQLGFKTTTVPGGPGATKLTARIS
jgi:serine/threonine-protein kinase RIM15